MLPSVDGSDATLFRTPSSPAATPLATPSSPAATQPSTKPTDTSTVTQTPCPTCNINRVAHQNDLVAAGVIPESLANWQRRRKRDKPRRPKGKRSRHLLRLKMENTALCRRVVPPGSGDESIDEWVQCDLRHLWFHLECAELEEVPDTDWLCHKCCVST